MTDVFLNDKGMSYDQAAWHFRQVDAWAREHCLSYRGCHVQDVSDFSYVHDQIACFRFANEQDAVIFKLKWL